MGCRTVSKPVCRDVAKNVCIPVAKPVSVWLQKKNALTNQQRSVGRSQREFPRKSALPSRFRSAAGFSRTLRGQLRRRFAGTPQGRFLRKSRTDNVSWYLAQIANKFRSLYPRGDVLLSQKMSVKIKPRKSVVQYQTMYASQSQSRWKRMCAMMCQERIANHFQTENATPRLFKNAVR